jgi:hypothetical protein
VSIRWDLFLAAGLRQPGCEKRNKRIVGMAESIGMRVFAPGRDFLGDRLLTSVQNVYQNRPAHEQS